MQRFVLFHDGSRLGWQTAYLAFHIAARLGAFLKVLLINAGSNRETLAISAAQVEISGRAAGVAIETSSLSDFSAHAVKEKISLSDGLFIPRHLAPDEQAAMPFVDALSCPLWVVSKESEIREFAILVNDLNMDAHLINYTRALSDRLLKSLTGLTQISHLDTTPEDDIPGLTWMPIQNLSLLEINSVLKQINANMLFISSVNAYLLDGLTCNCIIYPAVLNP